MELEIKKTIYKDIEEYCKLKNLNIIDYINNLILKFHTANVYGELPEFVKPKKKTTTLKSEEKNVDLEQEITSLREENERLRKLLEQPSPKKDDIPKGVSKPPEIMVVEIPKQKRRILKNS